jgi:hypothetical protein
MDEQVSGQNAVSSKQNQWWIRWLWLVGGLLLVALGGIGVVVPGMPTTVFFIGAAACFARSSPRFEQWVLHLPRIGPLVREYRSGMGMPRRAKIIAVSSITIATVLSSVVIPSWIGRGAAIGIALVGIWFIMVRVPTRERVLADRDHG